MTKDLDSAKKKVATKSNEVMSLREQMETLKVGNGRKEEEKQRERDSDDSDGDYDENEATDSGGEDEENEHSESQQSRSGQGEKRVATVKGIDFVKERPHLSRLTVVKLKYYAERNGLNVGKVRKAELVKIIGKDIDRHFDV